MSGARDKEIYFSSEQWQELRSDDRLIGIATLARATNALAMAYPVLMIPVRYQSPRARRDRTSGFLYAAAVLFEGLQVSKSLAKFFRDLPQFQSGFGLIHSDKQVQRLESRFLKKLRDKAAFHFDRDVMAEGFKELDLPEARFASGRGWRTGSTYFDIVATRLLKWSDVAIEAKTIRWRGENDKIGFEHVTWLTPAALQALEQARRERPVIGEAWVFGAPGDASQPVSRHLVRDWWQQGEALAKVPRSPGLGWHSLRRKFATELKHVPLKDLCYLGGWKEPQTVLKCYQRADADTMKQALATRKPLQAASL